MSPYCDQITCVWAGASWAPTIRMDAFQRAACTTARPSTLLSPLSNEKERTDQESEQLTRCMRNSQGGVSTLELWSCRCRCDLLKWYLTKGIHLLDGVPLMDSWASHDCSACVTTAGPETGTWGGSSGLSQIRQVKSFLKSLVSKSAFPLFTS